MLATEYHPQGMLYAEIERHINKKNRSALERDQANVIQVLNLLDKALYSILNLLDDSRQSRNMARAIRPALPRIMSIRDTFQLISSQAFNWSDELDVAKFHVLWMQIVAAY